MALLNRESDRGEVESQDAIALLEADHRKVAELVEEFERAAGTRRQQIARQICDDLRIHSQIEEELFYPAARGVLEEEDQELVDEADVEHASIKGLVSRISEAQETGDHFTAFVTVLGEYVRHHVEEEENELFPKLKRTDLDLEALGGALARRKRELQANMQ
jgi:hemerythrin superfamily protein